MRRCALLLLLAVALGLSARQAQASPEDQPRDTAGTERLTSMDTTDGAPSFTEVIDSATLTQPGRRLTRRKTLTGDWCGTRSCWEKRGIRFSGRVTQYFYGVSGGVHAPVPPSIRAGDATAYTGRGQYDVRLDFEKLTRLRGGSLFIGVEHWFGDYGNVSSRTGAFPPAVFPAGMPPVPDAEWTPQLTNFFWTQVFSKQLALVVGKKDVLGAADQDDFSGGDGTKQFVNQALMANPAFLLGLPYSSWMAAVAGHTSWGGWGLAIYDARDRSDDFLDVSGLFDDGLVLMGEIKAKTCFFGRPGQHHIGAVWKQIELPDLRGYAPPGGDYPYPRPPGVRTRSNGYTVYYGFDQYVQVYAADKKKGWGVFGRASVSDENPTPLEFSGSVGIGGYSPLAYARGDRFGIGFWYTDMSSQLRSPRALALGVQDGYGMEVFYNIAVRPWLQISPDLQLIQPEFSAVADTAFLAGLRVNIEL